MTTSTGTETDATQTATSSAPTGTRVAALRVALAGLPTIGELPDALAASELQTVVEELAEMQTALDAAKVAAAGLIVRQWQVLDQMTDGRALKDGHRTPAGMLAARWQTTYPAARQLCLVAEAITPRRDESGETEPPTYPLVGAALNPDNPVDGHLSIDQAAVIVTELEKAAPGCTTDSLTEGERLLVSHAPNLTVAEIRTLAGQVRDRLDLHGILPREKLQTKRRSLTISSTSDGMTHIDWYLHPEAAGHVITAIDTLVGTELRAVRFRGPEESDDDERRSIAQIRSDAATDVFRNYGAAPKATPASVSGALAKPAVTMIVRIGIDHLRTGVGYGEIDGIPSPISAGTARRLAADANIIPAVLNGASEILDLGRAQRLFTPQQKLALAERDGGCAWPGCVHPPSYTEAHHIRWWEAHNGTTDLDNGILLCSHHHHRIHNDGWEIEVRDNVPWFTPPSAIDSHRRPRQGGRVRLPF